MIVSVFSRAATAIVAVRQSGDGEIETAMRSVARRAMALLALAVNLGAPASAADVGPGAAVVAPAEKALAGRAIHSIAGRALVVDGRTLWFPQPGIHLRLSGIDACELPQWSFDPIRRLDSGALKPVPCGAFAKAWLKRSLGGHRVVCRVVSQAQHLSGRCVSRGKDLGLELLKIGWARADASGTQDPNYASAQRYAVSARLGMWATYVLDMDEWRTKAVDRTNARRPIADENLLRERTIEISPPFADARRTPRRTDR